MEIDIDSWPFIPDYLEIEGKSEDAVYNIVSKLGFNLDQIVTKDVEKVYLDYGYNLNEIYDLKLEDNRR